MAKESLPDKMQLLMFRQLLSQQKAPVIKLDPVQDLGSGISQGVGNVLNALVHRRAQDQEQAYMDALLAQEQGSAGPSSQQEQLAKDLGVPVSVVMQGDPSTTNAVYKQNADQALIDQNAKTIQSLPQFQSSVVGIGDMGPNYGIPQDQFGADGQKVYHSTLPDPVAQLLAGQGGGQSLSKGMGDQFASQNLLNMVQGINPNTLNGYNAYQTLTGHTPQTQYGLNQQAFDSTNALINAQRNAQTLPYAAPQANAALAQASLGTQHQGMENQYLQNQISVQPQMLQQDLRSKNLGNETSAFNLDGKQEALRVFQQAANTGAFWDPNQNPVIRSHINALNQGQDPIGTFNQTVGVLGGQKVGHPFLGGFNKAAESAKKEEVLRKSQPPVQPAPVQTGPMLRSAPGTANPFQSAIDNLTRNFRGGGPILDVLRPQQ